MRIIFIIHIIQQRIVQMLKQINIINEDMFTRIPVYRQIFTPFLPSSYKSRSNNQQQAFLGQGNQIKFKYLSMVMSTTRTGQDSLGVQYVYGYDCYNGILDVASLIKNQRYRFILPLTCSNKQAGYNHHKCVHECKISKYDEWSRTGMHFEIKNKLLILMYRAHVYIHDLVRHNQHTNPSVLRIENKEKKSALGLISLRQNSHFIFKAEYEQNSVYVYLQIYSIDMANNFQVHFQCDHIIRIAEQSAQLQILNAVVQDSLDREGSKLILCAQIESTYPKQTRVILHSLSMELVCQNIALKINMFQADGLILNHSRIVNKRNYSQIRSSWTQINKKDDKQQYDRAISYTYAQLSGNSVLICYQKNNTEIIILYLCSQMQKQSKYVCTNIIEHQLSNKLLILDCTLNLWAYQFPHSAQKLQYSIINQAFLMQPLLICTFQQHTHPQYVSLNIKSNNIGAMVDTSCYICYPSFMLPTLNTLTEEQGLILVNAGSKQPQLLVDQSTSLFLSVQQSKFMGGNISIAHELISKMVKPYIPMLSQNQTFNIQQYLAQEVIPQIGKTIQIRKQICFSVKYEIVCEIINVICVKLRQIKTLVLGSIHDCQQNHFYWLISQLFNKRQQQDTYIRDIFRVLEMMTKQKQDIKSIISTILIEQRLLAWLKQKCDNNLYKIVCTSNFIKCSLSGGCPCAYKRLIKCLYMIDIDKEMNQCQVKKKIISILIKGNQQIKQRKQQEWTQEIEALMSMRYREEKEKMESIQKMKIQKIDEQFSYLFTSTRANTIDTRLEKQNILQEYDEGQNILEQNTIKDENMDVFLQLSTKQKGCFHDIAVSYRADEEQYKDMVQQYMSLYPSFTTQIISIYNQIAVNNFELKAILSDISQLLKREKLLSNEKNEKSKTRELIKQNKEQKQNKREKLLMVGIVAYKIYSDSLQQKFSSPSMSTISANQTELLRQLWVLILQIICYCIESKYGKSSQIAQMCKLFFQSTTNSRFIPALPLLLEKVSNSKSLMYEELYCLMESFVYTEVYRFNQTAFNNKIKRNREDIYQHQFKYDPEIWQKGMKKILKVFDILQFSTN